MTYHKYLFTSTESKRFLEGTVTNPPDLPTFHPWIVIMLCHLMLVGLAVSSHARLCLKGGFWEGVLGPFPPTVTDTSRVLWEIVTISLCLILPNINSSLVCKLLWVQNTLLWNQICLWILFIKDLLWWSQLQFLGPLNWISPFPSFIQLMSQLVCLHESELVIT